MGTLEMSLLVMKFGGSCIRSPKNYGEIADLIIRRSKSFEKIVVVMSAMNGATDELIALAKKVHPTPPMREQDMLISVGERVSIALLAMALDARGFQAVSFTGSQSGIITTADHTNAKIVGVRPKRILSAFEEKKIAIVAGFQGVSHLNEITTLGRGGADTTAVALAVALGGLKVEFYKDIKGIFSEDPKVSAKAEMYRSMSHMEALRVVSNGAKVLHARCVKLAAQNQVQLRVLSFKEALTRDIDELGTTIGPFCQRGNDPVYEKTEEFEEVCS